ncbi:MAG TPA: transcription termination/antitermination protein NusA [Flavobacteriales bacterium]|nr:transcription termination/antitermination protein NusA [Flavobacteriales bacterium]
MDIENLIESFSEFKEVKNINRETMMNILEDVFKSVLAKKYDEADNFDVIINVDKGDLEIWRNREVVKDGKVENPITQISLSDALKIEDDYEVGEEVSEQIDFDTEFGRRHVLSIRQNLQARVQDLNRDEILKKYSERVGEIVSGEVYQVWRNEILLQDDEGNDLILPKANQIPRDFFRKGETVKAVILSAELKNNKALIILSRIAPEFIERLFETEVPEVFDGLITIKKVVRIPGERAKVAVESYDDRIDPVGACVGMKGSRIHGIVRELRNENIDVINFTENTQLLITRSLSPAKVSSIKVNEDNNRADVYMQPDQVSLAIGKGGFNIKLAGLLTGYEIDVYRDIDDMVDDVAIEEFSDEIESWIIEELKAIGCDSARSVLELDAEDLVKRTDLEIETVENVLSVLKNELETEEE